MIFSRSAWVAQWVKHLTLGFVSGHDLTVHEFEPRIGSVLRAKSLLGILSLHFLSAPPQLMLLLCQKINLRGPWVAQSVKCPTIDFGSGHDLTVHEFEHHTGLHSDSAEPAWDSVSLPLCLPHPCSLSVSLSQK